MKKFTMLMAAGLVAMSANAALYVTGGQVEGQGEAWKPLQSLVVEAEGGVYTFQATNAFKVSTVLADWDNGFNANAITLDGAWNKGTSTATANMKQGSDNVSAPMVDVLITYTIAEDLSTITATLPDGLTFGEAPAPEFCLRGAQFGWQSDTYKFTNKSENVYEIVLEDGISGAWKVYGNDTWFGQGEAGMPELNKVYNLSTSGGDITTNFTGKLTLTFTYVEGGTSTIVIAGEGDVPPVVNYPEKVYIVGTICGWKLADSIEMKNEGEGIYTVTVEGPFDGYEGSDNEMFRFLTTISEGDASWSSSYGADSSDAITTDADGNVEVTLAGGTEGEWHGNVVKGSEKNWYFPTTELGDSKLSVKLNLATMKVSFGKSEVVAVETINAASAEAIYFNLQGARVANPENGIYIRVENGKAQKVLVK